MANSTQAGVLFFKRLKFQSSLETAWASPRNKGAGLPFGSPARLGDTRGKQVIDSDEQQSSRIPT